MDHPVTILPVDIVTYINVKRTYIRYVSVLQCSNRLYRFAVNVVVNKRQLQYIYQAPYNIP